MHRWTTDLLAHLAAGRAELLDAIEDVAPEDRMRCPSVGRWSVANVLSHLARTEGQVAALLQRQTRSAGSLARAPQLDADAVSVVSTFDGVAVLDRSERVAAPAFAQPDLGQAFEDATNGLVRARARLEQVVVDADSLDMRGVRQQHHLFGVLDFYQWVAFAGFHERRHSQQLREIAAGLGRGA